MGWFDLVGYKKDTLCGMDKMELKLIVYYESR
jgi:hypothetical protein